MSRMHASCLAIIVLLISSRDAGAQHFGAHHGAAGVSHGGAGLAHPGAHWGWGHAGFGYPIWGGYWYDPGNYATGLGNLYAGQGLYLQGVSAFNLNQAMAAGVATRTSMIQNAQPAQPQRTANRPNVLNKPNVRQRKARLRRAIDERLILNPTQHDIIVGDALNAATAMVKRHKPFLLAPDLLNAAIPPECLRDLTFVIPAQGVRINLHEVFSPEQWPTALRENHFAPERCAYESAVNQIMVEYRKDTATPQTLRRLDEAVERLRGKLDKAPPTASVDREEARSHINALAATAKMIHNHNLGTMLVDVETNPPRTLGALIGFMDQYNLRFGRAETARQRKAHQDLYPILARALDKALEQSQNEKRLALLEVAEKAGEPR